MTHWCLQPTRPVSKKFRFKKKEQGHNFPLQVSFGLKQPLLAQHLNHFGCVQVSLCSVCASVHLVVSKIFSEMEIKWLVYVYIWQWSQSSLRASAKPHVCHKTLEEEAGDITVNIMGYGITQICIQEPFLPCAWFIWPCKKKTSLTFCT